MKKSIVYLTALSFIVFVASLSAQEFKLNSYGYLRNEGIDVMAFDDIYPEGHQGGVSLIMNGVRVATNGDIRLEATPGQWQPVPKQLDRKTDEATNTIVAHLCYPDSSRHLTGFNPMIYPDLQLKYSVTVKGEGASVIVTVDLDSPIPQKYVGKVGFNLELFPGDLFGKSWIMDAESGIFPQQPNGPTLATETNLQYAGDYTSFTKESGRLADKDLLIGKGYSPIVADDVIAAPYAEGHRFTVRPDDLSRKFSIQSETATLKLYDGRLNHNNGWFVVRSEVPAGATKGAIRWIITPEVTAGWLYTPVIQTSQIGYHPNQPKIAVIELDERDQSRPDAELIQLQADGEKKIYSSEGVEWGKFLRYNYVKFDFSEVKEEGLYQVRYGKSVSSVFRIAKNVYDRGVWQPVLEYFLPVQMCHIRVNEKYRVWHDDCHEDDARMASALDLFDGYAQDARMITKYKPGEVVPGLNIGGWHDAGDFDLRIESQSGEAYILALAQEAFHPECDETSIDYKKRIVEIHQPDGKSDNLQQIENGALTVVAGYKALGRLYRGIICSHLRQYVMLGDAAAMTDGQIGNEDDRWVFTEDNPARELGVAAAMAAVSRVLKEYNDTLSVQSLDIARELFEITRDEPRAKTAKIQAAVELLLTTGDKKYKDYLLKEQQYIVDNINRTGWFIGRADEMMQNKKFTKAVREALIIARKDLEKQGLETPYGVPYRPNIWGAGWDIQSFGYRHYFLAKSYPDIFGPEYIYNALNFVLGCHPGRNTASFASGVGAQSATVGYGLNRADWSYIPGGVISGTALIRPDFPELLTFPYLWQQTEYVLGGGSSHYLFLVLAAQQFLNSQD